MAEQAASSDPPPLLLLPPEILYKICEHLDYVRAVALSLTCRALYPVGSKFKTKILHKRDAESRFSGIRIDDLIEIEKWPCYDNARGARLPVPKLDYFACAFCKKIRCASKFSNPMMRHSRSKYTTPNTCPRMVRCCIDCGVKHWHYPPGIKFKYGGFFGRDGDKMEGGGYAIVCLHCHQLKLSASEEEYQRVTCQACRGLNVNQSTECLSTPRSAD